jgi:hypothetical protein
MAKRLAEGEKTIKELEGQEVTDRESIGWSWKNQKDW